MLTSPDDCKLHPLKSCAHVTPAAERDRLCQKPSHSPETARVPGAVTAPRWKHRGGLVCSGGGVQPGAALASPASLLRPARSCRRPAPWSCTACIVLAGTRGPGSVPGRCSGRRLGRPTLPAASWSLRVTSRRASSALTSSTTVQVSGRGRWAPSAAGAPHSELVSEPWPLGRLAGRCVCLPAPGAPALGRLCGH